MPNYTILLVDYEPRSVERSRRPLAEAGFKVHLAGDGVAALDAFEQIKPDLVLIEAMLPKKHGFEVCQQLKQTPEGKRTPILITTAVYKGRKYRSQALHLHGADEYVEKPIADDQLVALVRLFLEASAKNPGGVDPDPPSEQSIAPVADTPNTVGSDAPSGHIMSSPEKMASAVSHSKKPGVLKADRSPRTPSNPAAAPSAAESPALREGTSWPTGAGAIMGGLTEDEIASRLDEVLPPDMWSSPAESRAGREAENSEGAGAVSEAATRAVPPVAVADAPADGPLDSESEAEMTVDDMDFAVVVDAPPLQAPTLQTPPPLEPTVAPEATDLEARDRATHLAGTEGERVGVVRFDPGRPKNRKNRKGKESVAVAPTATTVDAPRVGMPSGAPEPPAAGSTGGGMEAETAKVRRAVPIWVWPVVVAAIAAGVYFTLFREGPAPEAFPKTAAAAPVAASSIRQPDAVLPPPTPPANETAPDDRSTEVPPAPEARWATGSPGSSSEAATPPRAAAPARNAPAKASGNESAARTKPSRPAAAAPVASVPVPQAPALQTAAAPGPAPSRAVAPPPVAADAGGLGIDPVPVQIVTPASKATRRAVQRGDTLPLAEVDQPPVALSRTPPDYPWRARVARQQGTVALNLLVDENGHVINVRTVSAPADGLGDVASAVAWTWTYKPAMKDGVAVKVWKPEQVIFRP